MRSCATTFAAATCALLCASGLARATPPPPDPRDVAVREAFIEIMPFVGVWEGVETSWTHRRETRTISMIGIWAVYQAVTFPNRSDPAIETLTYDVVSRKFKLFVPIAGGGELVDVAHPDANTLQWVSHIDGPAIRTTLTLDHGKLHETNDLMDVDGQIKPESDVVLERKGAAKLGFSP